MNYLRSSLRQIVSIIRYPKLFLFSKRMGKNNRLGPNGRFLHPEEIFLGDNIYIAPNFHISARNLKFGSNIIIGPNLLLECDDHVFKNVGKTIWATFTEERILGSVTIEDDVWIGGNVTILKNVIIGEGCIIGAASVVTRSLPPYSICVGSPCRPIKIRFTTKELETHLALINSDYKVNTVIEEWTKNGLV